MKMRARRSVIAVLVALASGGLNVARAQEGRAPYAPGETLTYEVTWSIFPAGEVAATLRSASEGQADVHEVTTTARSQGFVSLLFPVKNEFHSFFDPQTACSRRISKKVNEGRRHKETEIVFDAVRKLAILDEHDLTRPNAPPKHAENPIPSCVEDVVTAFYFLRREKFELGRSIQVPVNDGSKTYEVTVEVQALERIQTPLGNRDAFRVEPKVFGGLFKRKGRMLIWFSDDEQHLPLRIKFMITVGAITGTLKSVAEQPTNSSPKSSEAGAGSPQFQTALYFSARSRFNRAW
jgi:hypothetical protein